MKYKKIINYILMGSFFLVICGGCVGTIVGGWRTIGGNVLFDHEDYLKEDSINGYLESYIMAFEDGVNDTVFGKSIYIDVFGLVQKMMNKEVIPFSDSRNTIVQGSDGKLYYASSVTIRQATNLNTDVSDYADALIQLKDEINESGCDLLYIQAPQKYHEDIAVPIKIEDQSLIAKEQEFLNFIDGKVPYINLEKEIINQRKDRELMFYKTDHHWNTESAFWAYQQICKYLNCNMEYEIDEFYFSQDSWNKLRLEDSFLGSIGARVGQYYVGKDDYILYYPDFETEFTRKWISPRMQVKEYSGDFPHALIDYYEELIEKNYDNLSWGIYTGSDTTRVDIDNLLVDDGKKVLVVKDSYALPVCAFLSTVFDQLQIYDMRYSKEESLAQYILKEEFDLVIFLYNPGALTTEFFDFN